MKRILLAILPVLILIAIFLFLLSNAIEREVRIFAGTTGKTLLATHLHAVIQSHLSSYNDSFVTISRDASNRVTSVQIHSTAMNQFMERLNIILYQEVSRYDGAQFGIPLGNLSGFIFLSGKGPILPVKPVVLGNIASEIRSDFLSAGINQTVHRVTLHYSIAIRYLSPMHDAYDTISLSLLLSETLIVGNVPIYKD